MNDSVRNIKAEATRSPLKLPVLMKPVMQSQDC